MKTELVKEIAVGLHSEDGIHGCPPKRTRTAKPRDAEAEAIATITQAELRRNEHQNHARAVCDQKMALCEDRFNQAIQDVLANLDEVTRARVGAWIEARYGKL